MGFNPFRPGTKTGLDLVVVALALLATVAAVVWVFSG